MIHYFNIDIKDISLPEKFTYPFNYIPHPLILLAAETVNDFISSHDEWLKELSLGKMFGVLVVRDNSGRIGYLAGYSGNIASLDNSDYFVPPVFDIKKEGAYFLEEERNISNINYKINQIEESHEYHCAVERLDRVEEMTKMAVRNAKIQLKKQKKERDNRRKNEDLTPEEIESLNYESQCQKAEVKRFCETIYKDLSYYQTEVESFTEQISELKDERKRRSAQLQNWLFSKFILLNAKGEKSDLCRIFKPTPQGVPPAGAGECAAPKLLEYAYKNKFTPICMGEYWWGASPKGEIRNHGSFYPSCQGKCKPILGFMLQGLEVDSNPLYTNIIELNSNLNYLYVDDNIIIVDKPAGVLSVKGKGEVCSVQDIVADKFGDIFMVHRLDMATSGVLLIARDMDSYKNLQEQFISRKVKKSYIALLDKNIDCTEGVIELPLMPDFMNRPKQRVDMEKGRKAITRFELIGDKRIMLYPETGRTHQLRVHCAYHLGLNSPIKGDELYGAKSDRLYLHAAELVFSHPMTGEIINIKSEIPF